MWWSFGSTCSRVSTPRELIRQVCGSEGSDSVESDLPHSRADLVLTSGVAGGGSFKRCR